MTFWQWMAFAVVLTFCTCILLLIVDLTRQGPPPPYFARRKEPRP